MNDNTLKAATEVTGTNIRHARSDSDPTTRELELCDAVTALHAKLEIAEQQRDELAERLRPFAEAFQEWKDTGFGMTFKKYIHNYDYPMAEHCRAAAELLAQHKKSEGE